MIKKLSFFGFVLCLPVILCFPAAYNSFGQDTFLAGRMLVAVPNMRDPYFKHAVVYMVQHDAKGALGLIINRKMGVGSLAEMLAELGRRTDNDRQIDLYLGGPVSLRKVFVLHSDDFSAGGTLTSPAGISMTGDISVIDAIAEGHEPRQMRFMMGYAGWAAGQLEREIGRGDWLDAAPDKALIFESVGDTEEIWRRAQEKAGLTL